GGRGSLLSAWWSFPRSGRPCLLPFGERFGARSDLEHFFGDAALPGLVRSERVVLDQLRGVVRRVAHRDHSRGLLGRGVVKRRLVDGELHQSWQHSLEDRLGVGLKDVLERREGVEVLFLGYERKDPPPRR